MHPAPHDADAFNRACPVGTPVLYQRADHPREADRRIVARTRTTALPPSYDGRGPSMVWLEGRAGGVLLSYITILTEAEFDDLLAQEGRPPPRWYLMVYFVVAMFGLRRDDGPASAEHARAQALEKFDYALTARQIEAARAIYNHAPPVT